MLERRSVMEHDGVVRSVMEVRSVTDVVSTRVLCPRLEEPDVR